MTFGEKLVSLRKEKGLSQEALAEQLGTTRQAVSKWENGQGYPETEKLLMIGNVFEVSMDFLLKDSVEPRSEQEAGYYVSKEMAEGYLVYSRKYARSLSFGIFFLALAFVPYYLFERDVAYYLLPTVIIATVGIGFLASTSLFEEVGYKILKQEPLLIDQPFLQEIRQRYARLKQKNMLFVMSGIAVFTAGCLPVALVRKEIVAFEHLMSYYPLFFVLIAVGLFIMTRYFTLLEAYRLLANNEVYTRRFGFKLRRKMLKKFDDL